MRLIYYDAGHQAAYFIGLGIVIRYIYKGPPQQNPDTSRSPAAWRFADKLKKEEPSVVQLARGGVEEVKVKGHDLVLKVTATLGGEKQILLSFTEPKDYRRWLRRCKKVEHDFNYDIIKWICILRVFYNFIILCFADTGVRLLPEMIPCEKSQGIFGGGGFNP